MRVDIFDNTLICEHEDLQTSLRYIKDNRELPQVIEKAIINIISNELDLQYYENLPIKEQLGLLPKDFICKSINDINQMFSSNRTINYENYHLAYLMYYLPINVFKVWKPLLDLHIRSTLKKDLSILDIGTGPGSVPLGIIEFYKSLALANKNIEFSLEFTLLDAEDYFLGLAGKMIHLMKQDMPINLLIKINTVICTEITSKYNNFHLGTFDFITMSNFITNNEGNNSKESFDIVNNFRHNLNDDGSVIIIEPGDQSNCTELKVLRNRLINNNIFNLYSPCIEVWDEKENFQCSCFGMVRSYWDIPESFSFYKKNGLTKSLRDDIPFNYIVLRTDGLRKYDINNNTQHFTRFMNLNEFIGDTINIIAFIRTVIYRNEIVMIALCDGSSSFSGQYEGVWLNLTSDQLIDFNIDVKLVSGNRIKLMKTNVIRNHNSIILELTKESKIKIEY